MDTRAADEIADTRRGFCVSLALVGEVEVPGLVEADVEFVALEVKGEALAVSVVALAVAVVALAVAVVALAPEVPA